MEGLSQMSGTEGILHAHFAGLVAALEWVSAGIDLFAIGIMLVGALRFAVAFLGAEVSRSSDARVRKINLGRVELGRYILAGLELFIVSDIIHTALSLALTDLLFLGLLVVIRAVISYFLDREMAEIRKELK